MICNECGEESSIAKSQEFVAVEEFHADTKRDFNLVTDVYRYRNLNQILIALCERCFWLSVKRRLSKNILAGIISGFVITALCYGLLLIGTEPAPNWAFKLVTIVVIAYWIIVLALSSYGYRRLRHRKTYEAEVKEIMISYGKKKLPEVGCNLLFTPEAFEEWKAIVRGN